MRGYLGHINDLNIDITRKVYTHVNFFGADTHTCAIIGK